MAFELKILTDLTKLPKVVETNIDEIEPVIKAAISRVDGLVVTDKKDDILAADADAAKLTKMSTAIKRFRIDHIALWKEPMEAFEKKCKDAEKRLDEAADTLRTKTGEVKEMWRQKKRNILGEIWAKKLADAFGIESEDIVDGAHQERFFNHWTDAKTKGTWVNSSIDIRVSEEAMDAEIARMKGVFDAIATTYGGDEAAKVKARMLACDNCELGEVVNGVNAWKVEQDKMEAAKKALAESRKEAPPTPPPSAPTPPPPPPVAEKPVASSDAPVETYNLAITGTRAALIALRKYGEEIGIKFKNLNK